MSALPTPRFLAEHLRVWARSRAETLGELMRATPLAWLILTIPLGATYWAWKESTQIGMHAAGELFREERDRKTETTKNNFERALSDTYEALRIMATLPSVSKILPDGSGLTENGRLTVQQLADYLASRVAVSRVSVVAVDFSKEVPEITPVVAYENPAHRAAEDSGLALERVTQPELEETLLLARYFARRYPDRSSITGEVPAATSAEIVTSDNSEMSPAHAAAHDDSPRTGIVYAVPFYGPDGKCRGVVAAVLRTRMLARLLEEPYFVVSHGAMAYAVEAAGAQKMLGLESTRLMRNGREAPGHPYTRAIQCDRFRDRHTWVFATAVPHGVFESYPAVIAARVRSQTVLTAGLAVSFAVFGIAWGMATTRRKAVRLAESMTERVRLQERAMTAAHNGIVITDCDSIIRWVNPAFTTLTGYTFEEVVGQNPRLLKSGQHDDAFYQDMYATILSGKVWQGEVINRRKDGSHYTEEMTITPVTDETGQITHFVAVKQDITIRKQMEAELAAARDAALATAKLKSEFLANMSHEIRTPMNGVIGMAGLLRDTPLTPEQRDYTETIRTCGDQLLTIINDILDFSKIEAGKLAFENIDFDVRSVVESVVDLMAESAHRKRIEIACLVHQDLPRGLRGDPGRVRQVLLNLVGNAIKFTDRGEVVVRATKVAETATHVTARFSVEDTGIGIAPEAQARLFQAFSQADGSTTRKYGGTGLGLAISKRLVGLMGGEIGVDSEAGRGSTFWFTAQFERSTVNADGSVAGDAADRQCAFPDLRVLIVDDNETNRKIVTHQLRSWGVRQSVAVDSGAAALEALRHAVDEGRPFHLAILDMQMPQMDGIMLAEAIQTDPILSTTRLMVMSSLGEKLAPEQLQRLGIAEWLTKPVKQSRLYDCIANVLDGQSAGGHGPATLAPIARGTDPNITRHGARILLAEDNPVNQKVALRQLDKMGYSAEAVANGLEVLDALNRIPYDLVLMDCQMPELDGYAATAEIRRREGTARRTPIIAMTAHALQGDRERCLAAGMDDYISKPVKADELTAVLERWLSNRPATGHVAPAAPPPAIAPTENPSVNFERLRQTCDGDEQFTRELVDSYLTQTTTQIDQLRTAIAGADAARVERLAHTAAGASLAMGMIAIVPMLREIEAMGHIKQLIGAAELCDQAEREMERIKAALWSHFHPASSASAPPASSASAPPPSNPTRVA